MMNNMRNINIYIRTERGSDAGLIASPLMTSWEGGQRRNREVIPNG